MIKNEFETRLGEDVKTRLDSLDINSYNSRDFNPYSHDVIWYGIEAMVHCYVTNAARSAIKGGESFESFLEKTGIKKGSFEAPIKHLEENGIFVPSHTYDLYPHSATGGLVVLFTSDYFNLFRDEQLIRYGLQPKTEDYDEEEFLAFCELLEGSHSAENFKDPSFVRTATRFSRELWNKSAKSFEEALIIPPDREGFIPPTQPEEVTNLARNLIAYYEGIIAELEE